MDDPGASRENPVPSQFLEAEFIDTATSVDDDLRVVIPGFDDGEHDWDVDWAPRVDDDGAPVFPSAGNRAVVAETDGGAWIVVLWIAS